MEAKHSIVQKLFAAAEQERLATEYLQDEEYAICLDHLLVGITALHEALRLLVQVIVEETQIAE